MDKHYMKHQFTILYLLHLEFYRFIITIAVIIEVERENIDASWFKVVH